MASSPNLEVWDRVKESYIDTFFGRSIKITLQPVAGDITKLEVPDECTGFKLWPVDQKVVFSVQTPERPAEIPSLLNSSLSQNIVLGDLSTGHIAMMNLWEPRLLPSGKGRTLRLTSDVGGTVVYVEFFG